MSYTNCVAYNSTYHIGVHYSNNTQIVNVQQTELHSSFGTSNTIPGDPNGEQDLSIILGIIYIILLIGQALLAAVKDSVVEMVAGAIIYSSQTGVQITNQTLVLYSSFASYGNISATSPDSGQSVVFPTAVPNLIEQLLQNTTISLLSASRQNTSTIASSQSTINVYSYHARILWIGYGTCIGATLVAMMIGMLAVRSNGGSGDRSFSLLVATTRNPALDDIFSANGTCTMREGGLKNTKLMFATVGDEQNRLAFALEAQVKRPQGMLED
jgi:hypothetical protein